MYWCSCDIHLTERFMNNVSHAVLSLPSRARTCQPTPAQPFGCSSLHFYKLLLAKTPPLRREFDPEDSDQRHGLYDDETEGRGRRAGAAHDCISALLLILILHCKPGGFFSTWINGDMLDFIGKYWLLLPSDRFLIMHPNTHQSPISQTPSLFTFSLCHQHAHT